jgi:uncharacterized protein
MSFQSLQYFAETGDLQGVQDRLEEGEDPDEYDEKGMLALSLAAVNGHVECFEAILDASPDLSLPDKNEGKVAFHWALSAPKTDENPNPGKAALAITKVMIDKGADIEIEDKEGRTPLMLAAMFGHTDALIFLRERGAEINKKSAIEQRTPLHFSCLNGHLEASLALMARGAYTHHKDRFGDAPLVIASRNRHMDLALAMTQRGAYSECKLIDKALGRVSRVIRDKSKQRKKTKSPDRKKDKKKRGPTRRRTAQSSDSEG